MLKIKEVEHALNSCFSGIWLVQEEGLGGITYRYMIITNGGNEVNSDDLSEEDFNVLSKIFKPIVKPKNEKVED